MKKIMRSLTVATLAALLIAGTQMTAFAAVDASSEVDTSITASENAAVSDTSEDAAETAPGTQTPSAINDTAAGNVANPNTGVGAAPIAVALLGLAAIPVIVKTRK